MNEERNPTGRTGRTDSVESGETGAQPPPMRWRLALHMFLALFILCFFIKGVYFLVAADPLFSLRQYPQGSDLTLYTLLAMITAGVYGAIVYWSYQIVFRKLERRSRLEAGPAFGRREGWIAVAGIVLLIAYFRANFAQAVYLGATGAFLFRHFYLDPSKFYSGEVGVQAFFLQIQQGLLFIFAVYAVMKGNRLLIFLAILYCLFQVVLANGSRFTLLSALLLVPTTAYLIHWRRPHHYRWCLAGMYGTVLCLPFIAALLLGARNTGSIALSSQPAEAVLSEALVTFDSIDHLINYLYLMPVDWTGERPLEDFWQIVPRALYPGKPILYGQGVLQEQMYPGTKGAGTGTYVYGDYPLSCVVMALDLYLPVGLLLHGILMGAFLAGMDIGLARRSLLGVSFFALSFFFILGLIRSGIVSFVLGEIPSTYIPLLFTAGLLKLGGYKIRIRPQASQDSPPPIPGNMPA
ncbi:MAG TPA: hypothetical protein VFA07_15590 [Chthonomonadaceae bacterium]|nr:hypothetical protein [Chthonomonadaceae bacterium]